MLEAWGRRSSPSSLFCLVRAVLSAGVCSLPACPLPAGSWASQESLDQRTQSPGHLGAEASMGPHGSTGLSHLSMVSGSSRGGGHRLSPSLQFGALGATRFGR